MRNTRWIAALLLALLLALMPCALAEGTPSEAAEAEAYAALLPGDTGDAVVALQQRLIELGYLEGEPSGELDDDTAVALALFQADEGLEPDGEATAETQEALFAGAAVEGELTVDNAPYIANKNTKKFHMADCPSVKEMKDSNKVPFATKDEALEEGYKPCKRCNP